jgi:erythromycin esterase-like protein
MAFDHDLTRSLAELAQPLDGSATDFDALLELAGSAHCVLLGEATHGSHEFYRLRAEISKRLICEAGFCAIAAEADWPDAYRVNRYVRGLGADAGAAEALDDFQRFPAWMWRNADMLEFVGWLREQNERRPASDQVGFYGLDLYSLHSSIGAVLSYLDREDPLLARNARYRYSCFEDFAEDPQAYGYAASIGIGKDCEDEVVRQLIELQQRRSEILKSDGVVAEDEYFQAEQNARVVKNAEEYYRAMFQGRVVSWNVRDTHMADTLDALLTHLARRFDPPKVVVWAHNSHVGDARATEMAEAGELNLGQLVRERHPGRTRLVGFSTYDGTVTAASAWDRPAERKRVRPGLPGSFETLFHESEVPSFYLRLNPLPEVLAKLDERRLQRAIGVIYRPESERVSHYLKARLPLQFDALFHVDRTRALEPLERTPKWQRGELPETYPTGF